MDADLTGAIPFEFASPARGREILTTRDEYIKRLSRYEYGLKMGAEKTAGKGEVNEDDFLSFLESCVLPWEEEEISRLNQILKKVKEKLTGLKISLQSPVLLIKTDGREEWNSAYTRSGAIILPRKRVVGDDDLRLESLLIHEVFHIISRTYPGLRNILYGLAGFEKVNEILLPETLKPLVLTNPDAPYLNYYTGVYYRERKIAVIPVTLLKKGRKNIDPGKDILKSITSGLLALEKEGTEFRSAREDGEPVLLEFSEIQGFKKKTGFNKEGFFCPEEAVAEVFTDMVKGKKEIDHRRLLKGIKKILFQ